LVIPRVDRHGKGGHRPAKAQVEIGPGPTEIYRLEESAKVEVRGTEIDGSRSHGVRNDRIVKPKSPNAALPARAAIPSDEEASRGISGRKLTRPDCSDISGFGINGVLSDFRGYDAA
jgi:hypothetical protein